MNKNFIKLNDNNNHLSLGNFCRILKEQSLDKTYAYQANIFCTLFNLDTVNESTINNYCLGARSIGNTYKEQYHNFKKKYNKDKSFMLPIILNLISILDGYIYTDDYLKLSFINNHTNFQKLCNILYNIAKNDSTVPTKFAKNLKELLNQNKYYECLSEILFYIILQKKQPIYIENIVNETISSILTNTHISLNDLENFLNLQFKDGTNYIYSLKQLANQNNPYACFELGLLEYKGEITGNPRYNKSYEYFKIASSYNHPRANYLIAKLLLDKKIGTLSPNDIDLALNYLKISISLGSIAALNTLGLFYLNNLKDENQAIIYFKKATKHNYVYAYNNLGKIHEQKKDYIKAFNYYLKSASLEECWSCNKVGEMYRLGIGCEKNLKLSFKYYNQALELPINNASNWAKYNLAKYFYLTGNYQANIEKNTELAITLLTEASTNCLLEAQLELLYIYTNIYFQTKEESTLTNINNLIQKIENHPKFNPFYKQQIEQTILTIKSKITINKDIFN